MNFIEIAIVGFALAVDAMVYSFSYGLVLRKKRAVSSLRLAAATGGFQALMPLLGYYGGQGIRELAPAYDHWIVLAVFSALGGSIICQAWKKDREEGKLRGAPLSLAALLLIGLATSIDALAVGACMALGSIGGAIHTADALALAAGMIGLVTAACSLLSFHSARLLHHLPSRWLETLAGLLLIGLGIHALLRDLGMC